ncbi:hypothetical protein PAEVO_10010 [Paenibacillus sp. GM2FR]|nr:hypothetical protein PAEVO_10010 [Paenibacillus sp. GM2FR]
MRPSLHPMLGNLLVLIEKKTEQPLIKRLLCCIVSITLRCVCHAHNGMAAVYAQFPLMNTGSSVPSCVIPVILSSLEPIMKSTWVMLVFRPLA